MPFPKSAASVPTAVGEIRIYLADGPTAPRKIEFKLETLDAAGQIVKVMSGDLRPHLTPAQLTALNNFLDAMRVKSAEVLP